MLNCKRCMYIYKCLLINDMYFLHIIYIAKKNVVVCFFYFACTLVGDKMIIVYKTFLQIRQELQISQLKRCIFYCTVFDLSNSNNIVFS